MPAALIIALRAIADGLRGPLLHVLIDGAELELEHLLAGHVSRETSAAGPDGTPAAPADGTEPQPAAPAARLKTQ